jgi:hypothetical protein
MTESSTLTLPVSRSSVSSPKKLAHPTQVGFLAVLGVSDVPGIWEQRGNGSITQIAIDGMQRVECAYGPTTPAAKGSKSLTSAPATVKESGVPPRSRPV